MEENNTCGTLAEEWTMIVLAKLNELDQPSLLQEFETQGISFSVWYNKALPEDKERAMWKFNALWQLQQTDVSGIEGFISAEDQNEKVARKVDELWRAEMKPVQQKAKKADETFAEVEAQAETVA